ncbi:MAG: heavy metal translocating P-type ATPase [bacterium]|nr:heavy metal translocating P-type ATPase [bacterium]
MQTQTYTVRGMDCADCARTVEKGVSSLTGVQTVQVDFATQKLRLTGEIAHETLRQRVEALGYGLDDPAAPKAETTPSRGGVLGFGLYLLRERETQWALAGGALIALAAVLSLLNLPALLVNVLFVLAIAVAGWPIARSGLRTLFINRDFNINLLMTIAAVGAVVIGETFEGALVIFLFAVGEALEGYTADRARDSLRGLMALAPAKALRLRGDPMLMRVEEEVPVEALQVGDFILVKPGERIPMDGEVVRGMSSVNQATITGESIPVSKEAGEAVFAGTINGEGALEIRVTRLAADSTLSRIIQLVEEAQSVRAPSQRAIDQFARVYTPAVVAFAALVAIVPPLLFNAPFLDTPDGHGWLYRALALLVIACPCALVISTPVTVISAITAAARRGVLIKGGAYLEALAGLKALAFDKTGTLTRGEPTVTQVRAADCATGQDCPLCDDVLALASAVERRSTHPLARAVVTAAEARGLASAYAPAETVEALAGRGVRGSVAGQQVAVGSHRWFDQNHPDSHSADLCARMQAAETSGQTVMLLAVDEAVGGYAVRGYIAAADQPRAASYETLAQLRALGLKTVMLTGDNAAVARSIGAAVGVDEVRADLLPENKVEAVRGLLAQYGPVGMVGDGINDTPALAAASVGIAMGGAGSAQAVETADIALMADDLRQLPFALRLSRFARRLIRQNIALSLGMKLLFAALALEGHGEMWMAVFADMGMSLVVTLNGMRPLRLK